MADSVTLMSKLKDFLDSTMPLIDDSLTAIAREERIDLSKIIHWRDKSKTGGPDQLIQLVCALRRKSGETWERFGNRADKIFLEENKNETKKSRKSDR